MSSSFLSSADIGGAAAGAGAALDEADAALESALYVTSLPATALSASIAVPGEFGDSGIPGIPGTAAPPLLMFTIGMPLMKIPAGKMLMKFDPTVRQSAVSASSTMLWA
jgi:hypothetical protein